MDKESTCNAGDIGDSGSIPGSERFPGGGNGNHSSIFGLQSKGSRRVGHDWVTKHTHKVDFMDQCSWSPLGRTCLVPSSQCWRGDHFLGGRGSRIFWGSQRRIHPAIQVLQATSGVKFFFFSLVKKKNMYSIYFYLAEPDLSWSMWDLWSLLQHMGFLVVARDWTWVPCTGSAKS